MDKDNSLSEVGPRRALAALDSLNEKIVGMNNLKDLLKADIRRAEEALVAGETLDTLVMKPLFLFGEPGSGKTTAAFMLGEIYYALGFLDTAMPVIHSALEISSPNVNASNDVMGKWVRDAQNRRALLFVDEAHQLRDQSKQEGFQTLMAPLTDHEHPFMLVMACYPKYKDELLQLDPGGASRFRVIDLPNYSGEELHQILHKMLGSEYSVSAEADHTLKRICEYFSNTHTEQSGNGRRVENLLDELHNERRKRCELQKILYNDPRSNVIEEGDIPQFYLEKLKLSVFVQDYVHFFFIINATSAMRGERIKTVNTAMEKLIPEIIDIAEAKEVTAIFHVIACNNNIQWLCGSTAEQGVPMGEFHWHEINASGCTDISVAIRAILPGLSRRLLGHQRFRPIIILFTDGKSNSFAEIKAAIDELKKRMKTTRVAIGVQGYDPQELEQFASEGTVAEIDASGDVDYCVVQKLIFPVIESGRVAGIFKAATVPEEDEPLTDQFPEVFSSWV